jgi:hypothetical protein
VVDVGGPLMLDLSGPASSPVSDSLKVEFDANGRSLLGLVLHYGDGQTDSVAMNGSQSAGGFRHHRYMEPGDYTVTGEVHDGIEGTATADFQVTITP